MKHFSELKEVEAIEFSVDELNKAFSLALISLEEVAMSSSRSEEALRSSSKVLSDVSGKTKGSNSMSKLRSLGSKESRLSSKLVL